ncbi:hypothetical protein [Ideonella sp.]|uniref:hypothetical protein n=1 Tax=Ideonella sp. TaxID=1929293 RepID=UPI0035AFD43B
MHLRHSLAFPLAAFTLVLASCATTRVELDKMKGTQFPPASIDVDGKSVTIASIYAEVGINLLIDPDETAIPPFQVERLDKCPPICDGGGGDPVPTITVAELDALERGHRHLPVDETYVPCWVLGDRSTCPEYHLYGVVSAYYLADPRDPKFPQKGVAGLMWTQNRRAFALFYPAIERVNDPGTYLVVAAHEIGHAFNLHHQDSLKVGHRADIMYPVIDQYEPRFAALSAREHLQNHDTACIWPGKSIFGAIHANHDPSHIPGASQTCP